MGLPKGLRRCVDSGGLGQALRCGRNWREGGRKGARSSRWWAGARGGEITEVDVELGFRRRLTGCRAEAGPWVAGHGAELYLVLKATRGHKQIQGGQGTKSKAAQVPQGSTVLCSRTLAEPRAEAGVAIDLHDEDCLSTQSSRCSKPEVGKTRFDPELFWDKRQADFLACRWCQGTGGNNPGE